MRNFLTYLFKKVVHLISYIVEFTFERQNCDAVRCDGERPGHALLIVLAFGDCGDQARDTNAVATHFEHRLALVGIADSILRKCWIQTF